MLPHYQQMGGNLKRSLVFHNGLSPLGLLRSCLDFALNDHTKIGGVFDAVTAKFKVNGPREMLDTVTAINDFRNNYVAHQERELTDGPLAERQLHLWIDGLSALSGAE